VRVTVSFSLPLEREEVRLLGPSKRGGVELVFEEGELMRLLHAADYEIHGTDRRGKIHAIKEDERTWCGVELKYTGGYIGEDKEGERDFVTCKSCTRGLDSAEKWEQRRQELEKDNATRLVQRQQENERWWGWYNTYLQSEAWAHRRSLVLERCGGYCEGCQERAATVVHHTTYSHAGHELLFQLVGLCAPCHQEVHPDKDLSDSLGWLRSVFANS
jgi:hypothetical protein